MRILALDAATAACSVALWRDGEELGRCSESGKSSAAQILSMVSESLAEAQLALSALDAIACSIGPGAFTGVRISVAVAQGLAFGAGLPMIPITTLEALALQALQENPSLPRAMACLDARMEEVYWGCFAADAVRGLTATRAAALSSPHAVAVPDDGRYQGIGRGFFAYPMLADLPAVDLSETFKRSLPQARYMARLGALRFPESAMDPALITPLYLRDKVALTTAERAAQSH